MPALLLTTSDPSYDKCRRRFTSFSSPFTTSHFVSLALSPALYFSGCLGEPSAIIATRYYAVSKSGSFNKTAIHSVKNKLPCSRVCWVVAVSSLPPLPGASRLGPRFRGQGISGPICGVAYKIISSIYFALDQRA